MNLGKQADWVLGVWGRQQLGNTLTWIRCKRDGTRERKTVAQSWIARASLQSPGYWPPTLEYLVRSGREPLRGGSGLWRGAWLMFT